MSETIKRTVHGKEREITDHQRKYIVIKAIREYVEEYDEPIRPGNPNYDDLMQNIEFQVQRVLDEVQDGGLHGEE